MIPNLLLYVKPVTLSQGLTNQTAPGSRLANPLKHLKTYPIIPKNRLKHLKNDQKHPKNSLFTHFFQFPSNKPF